MHEVLCWDKGPQNTTKTGCKIGWIKGLQVLDSWSIRLRFTKCKKVVMRHFSTMPSMWEKAQYMPLLQQVPHKQNVWQLHCVSKKYCLVCNGWRRLDYKLKKMMVLWIDNKGRVYFFNSWIINGQTRSIAVRLTFVRELKEQGVIAVKWFPTDSNYTDFITKNVEGNSFNKQSEVYCCPTDGWKIHNEFVQLDAFRDIWLLVEEVQAWGVLGIQVHPACNPSCWLQQLLSLWGTWNVWDSPKTGCYS